MRLQRKSETYEHKQDKDPMLISVSETLEENRIALKNALGTSPDIIFRDVKNEKLGIQALVVYIIGLADAHIIDDSIIKPFTFETQLRKRTILIN